MLRKSSLRESLSIKPKKKKPQQAIRLKGRYLFRSIVRRILEYIDWFKEETPEEPTDEISIALMQRKKPEKKVLTLEDRSYLLIQPETRNKDDNAYIDDLLRVLKAFRKYPEDLRESIGGICGYQYFGPGRVLVRQNDPAHNLYYIAHGEVSLMKVEKDAVTDDEVETSGGTMGPGDMIGEIALLHTLPRSTTVITKTSVDLFYITKSDFERLLKKPLLKNWNLLRDALVAFDYFKTWDEVTVRECCILSKIEKFAPNEILLGDGKGMVNYVYFLLSGKCRLIEHMIIFEEENYGHVKYALYNAEKRKLSKPGSRRQSRRSEQMEPEEDTMVTEDDDSEAEVPDYAKKILSKKHKGKVDMDRVSVVTTTLQDVINQWHEITDIAAALMRQPSTASQQVYPEGVRTVFMQVCEFHRGACFGLGEEMRNRRIVSITPVRCLLVPRYWLFEHNRGNIWERVKLFMNMKYPSNDELFKKFVMNRRWLKYKEGLMSDIIKKDRNINNKTTIHDVPYSIRINQEVNIP